MVGRPTILSDAPDSLYVFFVVWWMWLLTSVAGLENDFLEIFERELMLLSPVLILIPRYLLADDEYPFVSIVLLPFGCFAKPLSSDPLSASR